MKCYTVHSNERQAQLTTATSATTSCSTNHRGSVDVPPLNTPSAELKRDPRKEERLRYDDRRERSSKHEERHRSDERARREERVSQYEERAKHEERARREERLRGDSPEKEKKRMSRHDDKNRYDERTRRDSSEKRRSNRIGGRGLRSESNHSLTRRLGKILLTKRGRPVGREK